MRKWLSALLLRSLLVFVLPACAETAGEGQPLS